ncbi:MAG: helix-turn-helix domain-containing protein [Alphaproteobacteria bacterium]|nr:helix-turn-helix domain-containing protein [Alphaproteobacteria bacterium]
MKDQKQLTPGESEVEERLRSAARTLRRLPNVKVQGYFSTWPTIIREPLEILQMEPEPMRITPSMADISEMEEVLFVWLKWLEPEERRLVWLRAERVRWKLICGRFGVGRTKAWEMYRRALASIAAKLR